MVKIKQWLLVHKFREWKFVKYFEKYENLGKCKFGKYGIRSTLFGEFDKFGEGRLDHYIYKIYIY